MIRTSLLVAAFALILMGCATDQPVQNAAALRSSHGYVVAAVPLVMTPESTNLTLRSLTSGREVALKPSGRRTLAAWVPAGSYEIAEMVGSEKGKSAPIEVAPGEATDLGALTWAHVGERQRVLIPVQHREFKDLTLAAIQQEKANLSGDLRQWRLTETPKPQDIPSAPTNFGLIGDLLQMASEKANQAPLRVLLKSIKNPNEFFSLYKTTAAPLIGEPAYDAHGNLYIGSNFGQLRRRDASGRWSAIDTGTLSPITAVSGSAQRLLVGTMDGRLIHSGDDGSTWQQVSSLGEDQYIFSIHDHAGGFLVLSGSVQPDRPGMSKLLGLSVTDVRMNENWKAIPSRKFDVSIAAANWQLPEIFATAAGPHYFVNVFAALERLDLSNGTWKNVAVGHRVSQLRASSDGRTLTAFLSVGAFSKLSTSVDGGDTWSRLETPPYTVINVQMDNPSTGNASRWDMGMFASSLQLLKYSDLTKAWSKVWTAPQAACVRTIKTAVGGELCVSNGGSVFKITEAELVPELLAN